MVPAVWTANCPKNWTVADLLRKHASIPFNPDIARVFFLAGRIDAWGSGIERILKARAEHGCPEPTFRYVSIGLMTTLPFRVAREKTTQKTTQKTEDRIRGVLRKKPESSRREISEILGDITEGGVKYQLQKLVRLGRIKRIGPDKGGYWEVLE